MTLSRKVKNDIEYECVKSGEKTKQRKETKIRG